VATRHVFWLLCVQTAFAGEAPPQTPLGVGGEAPPQTPLWELTALPQTPHGKVARCLLSMNPFPALGLRLQISDLRASESSAPKTNCWLGYSQWIPGTIKIAEKGSAACKERIEKH